MKNTPTTTKVATLTGAAKDDLLNGGDEDSGATLDVLANDPGSAALYSLYQTPGLLGATSQFPILTSATTAQGGTVTIVDGKISYLAGSSMQSLAEGEIGTDTFIYTVRMANGALSTATATVQVTGVNDIAAISGTATGDVTEDGVLTTGGSLSVDDADHDQSVFAEVAAEMLQGVYGDFTFNAGLWTYTLRNLDQAVQDLIGGQQVFDSLVVSSLDGTASETITVTIHGADELPQNSSEVNLSVTYTVNHGRTDVNGRKVLADFDSNDILQSANNYQFAQAVAFDYDDDGSAESTLVTFDYVAGGGKSDVEVVLVGYLGFTEAQLA